MDMFSQISERARELTRGVPLHTFLERGTFGACEDLILGRADAATLGAFQFGAIMVWFEVNEPNATIAEMRVMVEKAVQS